MSNDKPAKKRKLPELPRLEMRPGEVKATRDVVRGIIRGIPSEQAPSEPAAGQPVLSQPTVSQLAPSQPVVGQPTEPPQDGSLSQPAVSRPAASLLDSVPDSAGFTKFPNRYFDHLCEHISPDEQAVYGQLYRLSHGYGKDTCLISNERLSKRSGVPLSTMKRVVVRLIGRGLVEKVEAVHGPKREQGVTYRVPAMSQLTASQPKASRPTVAHNKENKDLKEQSKRESATPKDCPDCNGLGVLYPEGFDKGVAKCLHPKLSKGGGGQ